MSSELLASRRRRFGRYATCKSPIYHKCTTVSLKNKKPFHTYRTFHTFICFFRFFNLWLIFSRSIDEICGNFFNVRQTDTHTHTHTWEIFHDPIVTWEMTSFQIRSRCSHKNASSHLPVQSCQVRHRPTLNFRTGRTVMWCALVPLS